MPETPAPGALRRELRDGPGFAVGLGLSPGEWILVKGLIEARWLARLRALHPDRAPRFESLGIERYHEAAALVDHRKLWPKRERLLPPADVAIVRGTSLFARLEAELGPVGISDEDRVGFEEVYWRLVRPNEPSDVGPLHADRWFADVGDEHYPDGLERIKCWIAVACEPGRSGLRMVPASQRRDWRFHAEERDGARKPRIDEDEASLGAELLPLRPGEAVVFSEDVLHGGALNRGERTRVSLEFTMLVQP